MQLSNNILQCEFPIHYNAGEGGVSICRLHATNTTDSIVYIYVCAYVCVSVFELRLLLISCHTELIIAMKYRKCIVLRSNCNAQQSLNRECFTSVYMYVYANTHAHSLVTCLLFTAKPRQPTGTYISNLAFAKCCLITNISWF